MSTTAEPRTRFTPEDLLAMPDGINFELVDGHLVERGVSALSSLVALELGRRMGNHCKDNNLGWVFGADCGYQCFPDAPTKVRRPDVSYVRLGRLTEEQLDEGFVPVAPDLAVEVLSPHDLAYDVDAKIAEYLAAGVRLVWVVNPLTRSARVQRVDGSSHLLREPDELSGEDVLPGFRCRVGELFPAPAAPQAP